MTACNVCAIKNIQDLHKVPKPVSLCDVLFFKIHSYGFRKDYIWKATGT